MTSPAIPRRRLFDLPGYAWLALGVCAFAPAAGMVKRAINGELTAYGAAFGFTLIALFAGVPLAIFAGAKHLAPGRPMLRITAFWLGLVIVAGSVFGRAFRETRQQDRVAVDQVRQLANKLVAAESGKSPAGRSEERVTASTDPIVAARRAVASRMDAVRVAHTDTSRRLGDRAFFELQPLATAEAIAARRRQLAAFSRAIELLRQNTAMLTHTWASELRDRQVAEPMVRTTVALLRDATQKDTPRLQRLREKESALVLAMAQSLDLATAQLGRWSAGADGGITFSEPGAESSYREIIATAEVLLSERDRLRAELSR